jgi:hypothetical protein
VKGHRWNASALVGALHANMPERVRMRCVRHCACCCKVGSPHSMLIERRRGPASDAFMSVRLTHKYADAIDGVDLSDVQVGDHLRLPSREATLLIVEGWAVAGGDCVNAEPHPPSTAHDRRAAAGSVTHNQDRPAPVMTSPRHNAPVANASWMCGQNGPPSRFIQQPAVQTNV